MVKRHGKHEKQTQKNFSLIHRHTLPPSLPPSFLDYLRPSSMLLQRLCGTQQPTLMPARLEGRRGGGGGGREGGRGQWRGSIPSRGRSSVLLLEERTGNAALC